MIARATVPRYVAVIGATVTDAEVDAAAERVGALLAKAGVVVVTGGREGIAAAVVMDADAVIAFPGAYGTLIELGFALHTGRSIVVVGDWPMASGIAAPRASSPEEAVAIALSTEEQ